MLRYWKFAGQEETVVIHSLEFCGQLVKKRKRRSIRFCSGWGPVLLHKTDHTNPYSGSFKHLKRLEVFWNLIGVSVDDVAQ
jgi:hypothetical protein